ncbi:MAG TPA: energy transducer TonB [Candidatus Angelobacter sp.]|nr:energy transducer TonB [Candidatus Angelobacter sp.]
MRHLQCAFMICSLAVSSIAKDNPNPKSVSEAMERAAQLSQLTAPGSTPFHLKATIAELDSPDSDYKAEVEMYWVARDQWRRTLKSPDFSQTIIVNGGKIAEQNQGDYFPLWLNEFVIAMFDLAPAQIKQSKALMPDMTAVQKKAAKNLPPALRGLRLDTGTQCVRNQEPAGIPPIQNNIFTTVCFRNPPGLLESVSSPGFQAEFRDFKEFHGKNVARRISQEPEPGTKIEARVTELTDVKESDPAMFSVQAPSAMHERAVMMRVSEGVARGLLLTAPEIAWLPVRDGKTNGTFSLVVSVDKEGHVRETWPLNSDNPFPQDQARKAVSEWRFKPLMMEGVPVQMESVLTFAFQTRIGDPIPVLSDADGRKLAIETAEPSFVLAKKPATGTQFTVRVAVNEEGQVIGLKNINNLDMALLGPANVALHKWRFRPYIHDGKPDRFDTDITFKVP